MQYPTKMDAKALHEQARALYRKLNDQRKLLCGWRENAYSRNDWAGASELQQRIVRLDAVCVRAMNREFRREDRAIALRLID